MRQLVIVMNILGSFTIFALTVNLFDTLFMFTLFGILPGQAEPLSANQMLTIYAAATLVVLTYALRSQLIAIAKLFGITRHKRRQVAAV